MVIGITGGIGSGKSTVSAILEENGHDVILADDIAKEIMQNDLNVINKIKSHFGEGCYANGKLNPKFLAKMAFGIPENIEKLNSIVHPPTIRKIEQLIKQNEKVKNLIFVEAALIFEAKMEQMFNHILLVTANEDTRIKRVLDRDKETISEIKSRIINQIPEDQKRGRSDFIIDNDNGLEELRAKVLFFVQLFNNLLSST